MEYSYTKCNIFCNINLSFGFRTIIFLNVDAFINLVSLKNWCKIMYKHQFNKIIFYSLFHLSKKICISAWGVPFEWLLSCVQMAYTAHRSSHMLLCIHIEIIYLKQLHIHVYIVHTHIFCWLQFHRVSIFFPLLHTYSYNDSQ